MRGVDITGSHVVPLGWPVDAGVVLHIQLLAEDNTGDQLGKLGKNTQRQLAAGNLLSCLDCFVRAGTRAADETQSGSKDVAGTAGSQGATCSC